MSSAEGIGGGGVAAIFSLAWPGFLSSLSSAYAMLFYDRSNNSAPCQPRPSSRIHVHEVSQLLFDLSSPHMIVRMEDSEENRPPLELNDLVKEEIRSKLKEQNLEYRTKIVEEAMTPLIEEVFPARRILCQLKTKFKVFIFPRLLQFQSMVSLVS